MTDPGRISLAEFDMLYSAPVADAALRKVTGYVTDDYARLIAASPFAVLATVGPEGLDCSPRGDAPGFVRLKNPRTLLLPDRRGNNRVDSLRNVMRDPRIALLFLIPGSGTTLRVNGSAFITADPDVLASFEVKGAAPRSVLVIRILEVYFQCARAIVRSKLWSEAEPPDVPSTGHMLERLTRGTINGSRYDEEWPTRAASSLW